MFIMARKWWTLALRGLAAVLFGVAAFVVPQITLLFLVAMFGAYALVDGVFALVAAFSRDLDRRQWWALIAEGVAGVGIAVIAFAWPGVTAVTLVYLIAAWAVLTGVLEIIVAVRLRKEIEGEWLMALGGVLSIAFGALLAVHPVAGALSVVWLIGAYAVFFGALLIALGFRLRGRREPGREPGLTRFAPGH
jgi:uncharacterized membrane protein HdeD (DUF308 family)